MGRAIMFDTVNSALAQMSRGTPIVDILARVIGGVEDVSPGISLAVFLRDVEGTHLVLGAAPGLHQNHLQALGMMMLDADIWASQSEFHANDFGFLHAAYSKDLRTLAQKHCVHACAALPIWSATDTLLGIFVVYSKSTSPPGEPYRRAIAAVSPVCVVAIEGSINAAKMARTEKSLADSYSRMSMAIENSSTGIWDRDVVSGDIHYSVGWKAMFGYAENAVTNRIEDSYTRVHPDDLRFVQDTMQAHFERKSDSYVVEHRIKCADGSYKWASSRGKVVSRDSEGNALRMIGTTTDITAMRTLSDKLQQSVDLITSLTNEIPGFVYQYRRWPDGQAAFTYSSDGIRDIYELEPEQVAQSASLVEQMIHPDDLGDYRASIECSAASMVPWHLQYRVVLPRQGLRWRQGDARPRQLADGTILWHGFITDITERKKIEMELQEFATIDFLTRLPNRRYFMTRLDYELAQIQRHCERKTAVLMCDLDHFKMINDGFGHAAGDHVLQQFAKILVEVLRTTDTVGRIGGEEFAVVLSGASLEDAVVFAERIQQRLLTTPIVDGNNVIVVTVSIGIALMHAKDESAGVSLSRSDTALYRAKELGRNRIETNPY